MDQGQEPYLRRASFTKILSRGIKKILTEITSVKFLFLCFICVAITFKWIGDAVGVGAALVLLGLREIPPGMTDAILSKLGKPSN